MTADRKQDGFICISSCGKHKGDTQELAINLWDHIAWACQGLTVLKRGEVPAQAKIIIIWIPRVTLNHLLNIMKALSHSERTKSNSNVDLSPAARTLELDCLSRMPAQFPLTRCSFWPLLIHVGSGCLFCQHPRHTSWGLCLISSIALQSTVSTRVKGNHNLATFAAVSWCMSPKRPPPLATGSFWKVNSAVLPHKTQHEILPWKHKQMPSVWEQARTPCAQLQLVQQHPFSVEGSHSTFLWCFFLKKVTMKLENST